MGKSSKKIKSDRINEIRKKYDAFLEEDKKRQDRNKYILGCLDRVGSRSIDKKQLKAISSNNFPANIQERPLRHEYNIIYKDPLNSPSTLAAFAHEQAIMKELSKKYILIPKSNMTKDDNIIHSQYICPDPNSDTDWKTKYNILHQLKQSEKGLEHEFTKEEKEIRPEHYINGLKNTNQSQEEYKVLEKNIDVEFKGKDDCLKIERNPIVVNPPLETTADVQFNSIPKHSLLTNNTEYKYDNPSESSQQNVQAEIYNSNSNGNAPDSRITDINKASDKIGSTEASHIKVMSVPTVYSDQDDKTFEQDQPNQEYLDMNQVANKNEEQVYDIQIKPTTNQRELSEISNVIETNLDSIHLEPASNEPQVLMEVSNQIQQNENIESVVPNAERESIIEKEVDPVYEDNQQYQQDILPTSLEKDIEHEQAQIAEYEDEQRNLFYSEDTETYAYNEEAVHTGQENNEQYSYYEAVKEQPTFPAEIDEHLETNERYDPNYEQQYANLYQDNQYQENYYNNQQDNLNYQEQQQYQNYESQQIENVNDSQPLHQNYDNDGTGLNVTNTVEQQQSPEAKIINIPNENEISSIQQPSLLNDPYSQMILTEPLTSDNVEQQLDVEDGYIIDKKENNIIEEEIITAQPVVNLNDPSDVKRT